MDDYLQRGSERERFTRWVLLWGFDRALQCQFAWSVYFLFFASVRVAWYLSRYHVFYYYDNYKYAKISQSTNETFCSPFALLVPHYVN